MSNNSNWSIFRILCEVRYGEVIPATRLYQQTIICQIRKLQLKTFGRFVDDQSGRIVGVLPLTNYAHACSMFAAGFPTCRQRANATIYRSKFIRLCTGIMQRLRCPSPGGQ